MSTILDRYISHKRDNEQTSQDPRLLCPVCIKDRRKSKVFKNRRRILLHLNEHEITESEKRGLKILVGQYFKMIEMGIVK